MVIFYKIQTNYFTNLHHLLLFSFYALAMYLIFDFFLKKDLFFIFKVLSLDMPWQRSKNMAKTILKTNINSVSTLVANNFLSDIFVVSQTTNNQSFSNVNNSNVVFVNKCLPTFGTVGSRHFGIDLATTASLVLVIGGFLYSRLDVFSLYLLV